MKRIQLAAWVAGVIAAGAILWRLALRNEAPVVDVPNPIDSTASPEQPKEPATPPPLRRSAVVAGMVRVHVVGADSGSLLARSETAALSFGALADGDATNRASFERGVGDIQVDPSASTWLRVQSRSESWLRAHVRIPPFVGEHRVDVDLTRTALHLLVLDDDRATPWSGGEVLAQLNEAGDQRVVATTTTNAEGYARLDNLRACRLLVRTARALPHDKSPFNRPVQLAERCMAAEQFVCLVVPVRRRLVDIEVFAHALAAPGGLAVRLFLRDVERGELIPVPRPLRMGAQTVSVELPPGVYVPDVVPLGNLALTADPATIVVDGKSRPCPSITLSPNSVLTRVRLIGVDSSEFPLRVTARQPEACPASGQDLLAVGPTSWHLPNQQLPVLPDTHEIVVFTRRQALVSTRLVSFNAADTEIELAPASLLVVRWRCGSARAPVLSIVGTGSALMVAMRPDVVADQTGREQIAWTAEVVVRQGDATIECSDDSGRHIWSRSVRLVERRVEVDA